MRAPENYIDNNPPAVNAAALNGWDNEIANLILSAGITLSVGDLTQLRKAVADYVAGASYYNESGVADAYVLNTPASFQTPHQYFNGMLVRFRAGNANTGACTINVASLGIKNIKKADGSTDPSANDILTTSDTTLIYDGTNFRLLGLRKSRLDIDGKFTAGNISETFQKIKTDTLGGIATTISIPSLDGDTATIYKLYLSVIGNVSANIDINFNNDTGNNYGYQQIIGNGASITGSKVSATNGIYITDSGASGEIGLTEITIFAKSGNERVIVAKDISRASGSTLADIRSIGGVWSNTVSNITSIQLISSVANGFAAGTFYDLYARRA